MNATFGFRTLLPDVKMKTLATLYLAWQLLAALSSQAQTVIQGDSMYHALQPGRDSTATIVAQLGRHYRKKELRSWYTAKLRSGGCISGTQLTGYALRYKKLGVTFCVDNENSRLDEIQFDATASVVSARGIRPGMANFAEVIEKYGLPNNSTDGLPHIPGYGGRENKRRYYALNYPKIKFVSYGEKKPGENMLARQVQEIWVR